MKPFHQYWTFSAIRGSMTLLASVAIVATPQAASSILSVPVLIALAVDCLAAYSLLDGSVMVLLAKLLPARATNLRALYAQAFMAITTGMLLFLVASGAVGVRWLMWIVAAQAAFSGLAEVAIARDTHHEYGCLSCYATAIVLGVSALCLPFAGGLSATGMSLALALYVGAYGTSELVLGARMLFLEYRAGHPATAMSEAWRVEMLNPSIAGTLPAQTRNPASALSCEACPAVALCHDYSESGQLAGVLAGHVPAIVRSSRIETLLTTAQPVTA